jgi:hypothetical protein
VLPDRPETTKGNDVQHPGERSFNPGDGIGSSRGRFATPSASRPAAAKPQERRNSIQQVIA